MFAILSEVLLTEITEEIHHFAGWEGGRLRGTKVVNKNVVNKLAFPNECLPNPQNPWKRVKNRPTEARDRNQIRVAPLQNETKNGKNSQTLPYRF